jgi:hypothetical protein
MFTRTIHYNVITLLSYDYNEYIVKCSKSFMEIGRMNS